MSMQKPEAASPKLGQPNPIVVQSVDFDLNLSPSHLLHRAHQVAADLHSAAFGPGGLTQRQLTILIALGSEDGISQTQLVVKTGIDRSTLAEMVARMEVKGLMVRAKSPIDSRANTVHLTPSGRVALKAALPKLAAIDERILALVSSSRRSNLVDLLAQIVMPAAENFAIEVGKDVKKTKKKDKKKKDKRKKADKA